MLMINRSIPPVRTQIIGSGCFRCSRSHICRGKKKHGMTKNILTTTPSRTVRPNHLAHVFAVLDPAFVNAEEVFTKSGPYVFGYQSVFAYSIRASFSSGNRSVP